MIKFSTGEVVNTISVREQVEILGGIRRRVATIVTTGIDYSSAISLFKEGSVWSIVEGDKTYDVWNSYTKAGPITDNRDGTLTIKMGERNTMEQNLREMLDIVAGPAVQTQDQANTVRVQVESAASLLSDGDAAKFPNLSKPWTVGERVEEGYRRYFEPTRRLYKVLPGQGHITQADWTPDKTPSMWAVVDVEHAGTADDPIPAVRGLEYIYGKYYGDPEDGQVYLCQRTGEEEGGTVVLNYLPHELIGHYFSAAQY